jgi:hypothetical protein
MTESTESRNRRTIDDDVLQASLGALFEEQGPRDLRARVEQLIHEGATARRPGLAWGPRLALSGLATLLVAILVTVAWWSDGPIEHAARPAAPAASRPDTLPSVPPDAELFTSVEKPDRVERTARPRRLAARESVQRLAASFAPVSIPDALLPPDWAPVALGAPVAITTRDIGPPAITIEAQIVEELPNIEELVPCDQLSRVCAR